MNRVLLFLIVATSLQGLGVASTTTPELQRLQVAPTTDDAVPATQPQYTFDGIKDDDSVAPRRFPIEEPRAGFFRLSTPDDIFCGSMRTSDVNARRVTRSAPPNGSLIATEVDNGLSRLNYDELDAWDPAAVRDAELRPVRAAQFELTQQIGLEPPLPTDPEPALLTPTEPSNELPVPSLADSGANGVSTPGATAEEALPSPTLPDRFFEPMLRQQTWVSSRVGWWSVNSKGSPTKVGEYQSLHDSPFLDLDGLITDGIGALDFHLTSLDRDARNARLNWFGPNLRVNGDYQSYFRRLDRDPLEYYVDFNRQPPLPLPGPPQNYRDMKEDQAVGEDFAIRVQELNASFRGVRTEHFNWRLNVWGMRKTGERQANAVAHCFAAQNAVDTNGNPAPGPACHQLSQRQRIDWLTAEIEPAVEAKFGRVSAEYARTMRTLTTDDQIVTRPYDNFGFAGEQPYAMVPENYTYIDRVKLGIDLSNDRDFYGRIFNGNTHNEFRDTNRRFSGFDLRLSDHSIPGIGITGYAKQYNQSGQVPSILLPFEMVGGLRLPIAYDRTTLGATASWQPYVGELSSRSHWRLTGGYEYRQLARENALFQESVLSVNQDSTLSNQVHLRASTKVTSNWSSFTGYRATFVDSPLYGVPIANTTVNTSLPTQAHRIEFGNTWTPSHTFMLHNLLSYRYQNNDSEITRFDENGTDVVLSYWYAPITAWTFSGGLGLYANSIDQDITLGSKVAPLTLPWQYGGRSSVVNLGTTYAWTPQTSLSGSVDFVRGSNAFEPIVGFTDLPFLSDEIVQTTRFTTGVDHRLSDRSSAYMRYQLMDYDDKSDGLVSGTVQMLLVGLNAWF